ncbi:TIGR00730 family Rossman fold protein [Legionella maioricensis]|uniref:Cytokinin riboside 5'-monophosphate phosphoribohydrolase n=1 Tax=Legionella maioricensis TaxID=2896528 RepID=A0A9X2D1S1_9GAMM|nr:TIGR00730 family Rossman fold protein [Legionella maioricensis]MCL9684924.1 TIGR00730 family Rossman fold protein [Legionella maioricensis]MCL9688244.1 TIGR00730 family Rossman fold protein [Legionella maioricensis]
MKSIGVYLGAKFGNDSEFCEAAILLGKQIARMNLTLIYGASSTGMMGLLATTVKEHGGTVIGVTTNHLIEKEKPLTILDELHVVDSMQERKKMMAKLADAFIVMPGGLGTFEEAFETWNAIKIGVLQKQIGFLNINGYFDGLFSFIGTCVQSGFLSKKDEHIPVIQSNVNSLLVEMLQLSIPATEVLG